MTSNCVHNARRVVHRSSLDDDRSFDCVVSSYSYLATIQPCLDSTGRRRIDRSVNMVPRHHCKMHPPDLHSDRHSRLLHSQAPLGNSLFEVHVLPEIYWRGRLAAGKSSALYSLSSCVLCCSFGCFLSRLFCSCDLLMECLHFR